MNNYVQSAIATIIVCCVALLYFPNSFQQLAFRFRIVSLMLLFLVHEVSFQDKLWHYAATGIDFYSCFIAYDRQ
jgi:hypothetical protein